MGLKFLSLTGIELIWKQADESGQNGIHGLQIMVY